MHPLRFFGLTRTLRRHQIVISGLLMLLLAGCAPKPPLAMAPQSDDAFLNDVQHRTFKWFWETTNPQNGLVPDRHPQVWFSSVASVGFGLTAYPIGVERGWISREQALERTLTTLRFFWNAPQGPQATGMTGYKGFFYHFLDMKTGTRFDKVELSSIDTALFIYGALFSAQYFDRNTPKEQEIRTLADKLYRRVEWNWLQARPPLITMGWTPEHGFHHLEYWGYTEAMFMYIMAMGSPSYPIQPQAWDRYMSTYLWKSIQGYEHVNFAPLFGHQYTFAWIDPRGIQDGFMRGKGLDYFENSRRATLAQRAYAIENPHKWTDYSANIWGFTACDGPLDSLFVVEGTKRQFRTYSARGISADQDAFDDGTIAPTAAGGSLAFTPQESTAALREMVKRYGSSVYTEYGFLDSFNPTLKNLPALKYRHGKVVPGVTWVDGDYLGIDQGPILISIENHRSGLVWKLMHNQTDLVRGLKRAGFTGGWLDEKPAPKPTDLSPQADLVIIGSSTAEGTGPKNAANIWVRRLTTYLQSQNPDFRVVNLARGGYMTHHLLPDGALVGMNRAQPDLWRNVSQALRHHPKAIIINLPSNDANWKVDIDEQLENFEAIMITARLANVEVWITTPQPRNFEDDKRAIQLRLLEAMRQRMGSKLIDFWTDMAQPDGRVNPVYDSGDGIHLNDEAHRILFERVKTAGVADWLLRH